MKDVEKRAMPTFQSPSKIWKRFEDDTFVIINKTRLKIFWIIKTLFKKSITFTIEKKADLTLPFLDPLVRQNEHGGSPHQSTENQPTETAI